MIDFLLAGPISALNLRLLLMSSTRKALTSKDAKAATVSSRPPVAFQSGGGVARCRAGQKSGRKCRQAKIVKNVGVEEKRTGDTLSCPKDSVPHRVKSTRKVTFVAPSFLN